MSDEFKPNFEPMFDFGFAEKEKHISMFVANKITVLTPDEATKALALGYKQVTGSAPNKTILGLLVGQAALETGNFKSIHNYNFGNVRGTAPDGKWTSFRAGEGFGTGEQILEADSSEQSKNKFRAYDDAAHGAADYVRILKSRPHWWAGLQSQDPRTFVSALSTFPAYFTANPAVYGPVLIERMTHYLPEIKKYASSGVIAAIGAGLVATGTYLAARNVMKKG